LSAATRRLLLWSPSSHSTSLRSPRRPPKEEHVFTYRLHALDGNDLGEATYAVLIRPGDEIIAGQNQRFRVVQLIAVELEGSPLVGLLQVEAA
jgi:hypothetical protein